MTALRNLTAWFQLSRPPFHSVGILPFVLGTVVAWRFERHLDWPVFLLGCAGVVLIMLATYYSGEYWDILEDKLSKGRSRFAGGSQVLEKGLLPRNAALHGSLVCVVVALVVGLILQGIYRTGPWTIPLGIMGILGGFFYSARPVRWVTRGFGEIWIAVCYGWLPVGVGYYLQTSTLDKVVHWLSVPIGLTIFNVILLNEYPDFEADRATGKMNLLARVGPQVGSYVYAGTSILSWITFGISLHSGVPLRALFLYLPVVISSCVLVWGMLRRHWEDKRVLERMCMVNILVNLGTTSAYIVAFL